MARYKAEHNITHRTALITDIGDTIKMYPRALFILWLGLVTVSASPAIRQEIDNNLSSPNIKLEVNTEDHKEESGQYSLVSDNLETSTENNEDFPKFDEVADVDVIIEESAGEPNDVTQIQDDSSLDYFPEIDDSYRFTSVDKVEDEIMDTAAGVIPFTIFRRRQKPRRRYMARRRFTPRWNPYRNFQYFYPYYGFYRPSSFRYY